jgi:hypothetical protein
VLQLPHINRCFPFAFVALKLVLLQRSHRRTSSSSALAELMSLLKALGTLDFRREGSAWLGSSST